MAQEGERAAPPPAPPPLPPTAQIAPLYARADQALRDLDAWGTAKAKALGVVWGPPVVTEERGRGGREPAGQVGRVEREPPLGVGP